MVVLVVMDGWACLMMIITACFDFSRYSYADAPVYILTVHGGP